MSDARPSLLNLPEDVKIRLLDDLHIKQRGRKRSTWPTYEYAYPWDRDLRGSGSSFKKVMKHISTLSMELDLTALSNFRLATCLDLILPLHATDIRKLIVSEYMLDTYLGES
ncbi:hypothetical protein JCM11251_007451 [Rhodosporidiobolus azoricus]